MNYIRFAISNPVKVTVGVLLIVLFGLLAVTRIPVQLVPNVDHPVITIETQWTDADPEEIEREIVQEQEDTLDRVSGLKKMTAVAQRGRCEITLEFYITTDIDRARLEVSDRLREVSEYPDGVEEPVITVADAASQNAIAWLVITSDDPDFDVETIREEVEDDIKPFLERVDGISQINVYGGRDRELHVRIDPQKLAQRGIMFTQLRDALRFENVNISAGNIHEGRIERQIRTVGKYESLDDIRRTIVAYTDGGPVRVRDLGEVVLTYEKRRAFVRSRGQRAIALNAIRETGSNVITVMDELRRRIGQVNERMLPNMGPKLTLEQVYDETDYIHSAINLVLTNLWLGGALAVVALLTFLRRIRPTLIVVLAIPVSVIGTFVVMTAAGRNLNVVSLAGLAFAVGMVVDNAIVVLENIDRHLSMGKAPGEAAYDAVQEVWGAIVASTLTTLAVFVPVLFIQEEAGQLFRDIALAICAAVTLSLLVAVTVIPAASARWLRVVKPDPGMLVRVGRGLLGLTSILDHATRGYAGLVHWLSGSGAARIMLRVGVVAVFTVAAVGLSWLLMPPTTYLPGGNRNLIFGIMLTPPAYSVTHQEQIAQRVETRLKPYWQARSYDETAGLPAVLHPWTQQPIEHIPPIDNFFFVSFTGTIFMGASSIDPGNVKPLEGLLNAAMSQNPAALAFAFQPSIFGRGVGSSTAVELDIVGTELDQVRGAAAAMFMPLMEEYGKIRPDPANFNLAGPELQVRIDRVRASDMNVDVSQLGLGVAALVDGTVVGEYQHQNKQINLRLIRDPSVPLTPESLAKVPVAVRGRDGAVNRVPLSSLVTFVDAPAAQQIRRIEKRRAVTITIEPSEDIPLEQAIGDIEQTIADIRQTGAIAPGVDVRLAGTADKLTQVRRALLGQWRGWTAQSLEDVLTSRVCIALIVVFLLMAALFESFLYPLVIMFSVPLAVGGGFGGLAIVHHFDPAQKLDVLTMLGFVILIGVVVNNAILIVHQSLNFVRGDERSGAKPQAARDAIREAVRTRIRPIFMTTLTSVAGMLPLVLLPGAGSEFYRGLGSVVVGGLIVSTLFTLVVVPLLLSLVMDMRLGRP